MYISSTTINSVGLVCDILGAILLLFSWVAPQSAFKGILATNKDEFCEKNRKKLVRMNIAAWCGFGLIILGFVFQLISNYRLK